MYLLHTIICISIGLIVFSAHGRYFKMINNIKMRVLMIIFFTSLAPVPFTVYQLTNNRYYHIGGFSFITSIILSGAISMFIMKIKLEDKIDSIISKHPYS